MYKKVDIIKNVNKGFYTENQEIIYQSQNKLFFRGLDVGDTKCKSIVRHDFKGISKVNSNIIAISNTGYVIFDSNLNEMQNVIIDNGIGQYKLYNNKEVVINTDYDYDLFLPKDGLQDVTSNKLVWESNAGEMIKIENSFAFTISQKKICRRNIKDGAIIWTKNIENNNLYAELIGTYDNIVILGLQEKNSLLALDINTGAIKWEIDIFIKGLCIDEEKGLLHQLLVNYVAYDLHDGKLKDNYQNNAYFESVGIESQRSNFVLSGSYIITTDWQKGSIGAFNTLNHQFEWIHKEEEVSFPSTNPIVCDEPYLFIHDSIGNLHVFKKETLSFSK